MGAELWQQKSIELGLQWWNRPYRWCCHGQCQIPRMKTRVRGINQRHCFLAKDEGFFGPSTIGVTFIAKSAMQGDEHLSPSGHREKLRNSSICISATVFLGCTQNGALIARVDHHQHDHHHHHFILLRHHHHFIILLHHHFIILLHHHFYLHLHLGGLRGLLLIPVWGHGACVCVHRNMNVFVPPHPTPQRTMMKVRCLCAAGKMMRAPKWVEFWVRKWMRGRPRSATTTMVSPRTRTVSPGARRVEISSSRPKSLERGIT